MPKATPDSQSAAATADDIWALLADPERVRKIGTRYIDVEQPFEAGNVWDIEGTSFTAVPNWWRPFLYRVLKPNELAIYLYICSYAQKPGIAYVSLREMQRDFGLTNRHELIAATRELVRLGFLLLEKGRVAKSRTEHDRNIFQRPSMTHTLLRLLERGVIDGEFRVTSLGKRRTGRTSPKAPTRAGSFIDKTLLRGLAGILGADIVGEYLNTPTGRRSAYLKSALKAKLDSTKTPSPEK